MRDLNRYELIALVICAPLLWPRHWRFRWTPPRGMRAVVLVAALAILARLALLPLEPVPAPRIHDEFSFLLQADTFLHGRLSNPTPPMWQHFESMHIFLTPTYASMYFPIQGMILAAGTLLGHPWIGVLLASGVMCAAITWMLQGWLPPRWAFVGGIFAVIKLALFSYWVNGYYGGEHAAIGGALVLGAWPRVARRPRLAWAMAAGIVILAWGRPFEGLFVCATVGIVSLFQRNGRVLAPMALALAVSIAGLAFFCWRVTGDPLKLPYEVNREQYGWPQTLLLLPPEATRVFRHVQMAQNFQSEWEMHEQIKTLTGALSGFLQKVSTLWSFYLGPAASLSLLAMPRLFRDRRVRPLVIVSGVLLAALSLDEMVSPHYAAPIAGAIMALVMQGFRHLQHSRWRNAPAWAACAFTLVVCLHVAMLCGLHMRVGDNTFSWCCEPRDAAPGRADFVRELDAMKGHQLVFVRYAPSHSFHDEWVYNGADIPSSRVIWARVMGEEEDRRLIDAYPGRRVWIVEPDASPPRLSEYTHAILTPR